MNSAYIKNYIIRHKLKAFLQIFPSAYVNLQRFRYRNKKYLPNIISRETDILIEGFPRSANSFSVKAFKYSNGESYRIATHLHVYPQIIMGVKYGTPSLVLIREPIDCLVSYAALKSKNIPMELFLKSNNLEWFLDDYIIFYGNLKKHKNKFIVAEFNEVLNDFGAVLRKVNTMYNTQFVEFDHTDENVQDIFRNSGKHLSPSKDREELKSSFKSEFEKISESPKLTKAIDLYKFWTDL